MEAITNKTSFFAKATKDKYTNKENYRKLIYSLFLMSVILFAMYVFVTGQTVFSILEKKVAIKETRALQSEVSSLELQSLDKNSAMDATFVYENGFTDDSKTYYATREIFVSRLE